MKYLNQNFTNTKLISFARPVESVNEKEINEQVAEYGTDYDVEYRIAEEVNESMALKRGLEDNAPAKMYKDAKGQNHFSSKLSEDKIQAIADAPFTGFAKQIANTIVENKTISEKQFDVLAKQIFNFKY